MNSASLVRSTLHSALVTTVLIVNAPAMGGESTLVYRKVALTGEPAPGTEPGTVFATFTTALNHSIMTPRVDEQGRVAFIAIIDGVAVDEGNRSGIWADADGQLSLVVRAGDHAPGTPAGVVFSGVPSDYLPFPPDFSGGRAAFQGVLTGPGVDTSNDGGLWIGDPSHVALVAREEAAAPGTSPGVYFSFVGGEVDPQGKAQLTATLAGTGTSSSNDDSLWSDRTGALASIVREGNPAPGLPGAFFGSGNIGAGYTFARIAFNDASALAVQANLVGSAIHSFNDECIFVERNGSLVLVARDGDPAPGVENPGSGPPGGTFAGGSVSAGIFSLSHNDRGHVAFTIRVGGSNWNTSVLYSDRSGVLWPVAQPGDPAPGTGGATLGAAFSPVLNDEDRIAFTAAVSSGQWPPLGIFWDQPGALAALVLPGQTLAGMTVHSVSRIVGFNAAGDLAFGVDLEHPTEGFKAGLALADSSGALTLVVATGQLFDVQGNGSDLRQVLRVEPGGLSDNGSVAFRLDFTDNSSGHFTATIRYPGATMGLRVAKAGANALELSWAGDCAGSSTFGIYRGDLDTGLASLAPVPGHCAEPGLSTTVPIGVGHEFFLVVPNTGMTEGSYGANSAGQPRSPAQAACFPQGGIDVCAK